MPIENINPQRYRTFSLVVIDKAYKQKTTFFYFLLQACINSHDCVIDDPYLDLANDILFLRDNMIE